MVSTLQPIVPRPFPGPFPGPFPPPFLRDRIPGDTSTNASISVTGTPSASGSTSSRINYSGDHDWFRVELRPGELYQFEANTPNSFLDPTLALRDASGAQVAYNDDRGSAVDPASPLDSRLTYRSDSGGTYYLDVGGYANRSTGDYTVLAREVPANTSTYSSIRPNQTIRGDIQDANDQDWHRVFLQAGRDYSFDVTGNGPNDTLGDPTLAVRDDSGARLAYNDDSNGTNNSHIDFTPGSSGNYYLDVGGYSSSSGAYTLTA
ncbi:conserved protein of unknown function [Rhodovastum atsumiense]|nr:pre-peptidase C-terminal domain-containing protein [Rhodovastum atsumiense]CAH2602832.1 conserved protein of unknown function [Rhodovastum atsumiense]